MINDDNNSSNSTASSTEYPQYRGPTKLVWEDGRQVMRPNLEAISQGTLAKLKSDVQQHGATVMKNPNRDPYAGFRDVPNFLDPANSNKGSNGHYSTSNSSSSINDLTRSLSFMRKIAGN